MALHLDAAERLARRALEKGGKRRTLRTGDTVLRHVEWDIAGRCQNPVHVSVHVRPDRRAHKMMVVPANGRPLTVDMSTKCRKCPACLKLRAAHWRLRALSEYGQAPRTWFGTLTLNPEMHMRVLAKCRSDLHKQGLDFEALAPEDQFSERHKVISREITLYLKRLRERSGAEIRFFLVAEAHKSGLPHYHMLVHETRDKLPVRKRHLDECWRVGFSQWRLVTDKRAATYLCKYLSKDNRARVRASIGYGNGDNDLGHSLPNGEGVPKPTPKKPLF